MLDFGTPYVALLTLVLVRISGIVLIAPIFGTNDVPPTVRAFLTLALALLVAPVQAAAPPTLPSSLVEFSLIIAAELLIGIVLGLGVTILFSAFQLTGGVVGQLSGMSLGEIFNPALDDNVPLFSHLLYMTAVGTYVVIGGHRLLLGGLLETFAAVPPGSATLPDELDRLLVDLLTESFRLGLRAAAPAATALLLATVVLGLVSRSLPQLNIFALGFGLNALTTFAALAVSLGGVAWLLQDRLGSTLDAVINFVLAGT
jgi:flagellar biosynthetic protein FliR